MSSSELDKQEEAARDLIEALRRVSSDAQAPPDFQAAVMAKIAQLPPPRLGFLGWWRSVITQRVPVMIPAVVTAVLALSLSLNVWLGTSLWETPAERPQLPEGGVGDAYLRAVRYQARIQRTTDVGMLARAYPAPGSQAVALGFGGMSDEAKFFILGTRYAETVAYLQSDQLEAEAKREAVASLAQALLHMQAPPAFALYVSTLQELLGSGRATPQVLSDMLALLQSLCEEYAQSTGEERLLLFRAGVWLVDLRLTAAAREKTLLQQPAAVRYFRTALERWNVPPGVLDALDQIGRSTAQPAITDADITEILKQIEQIQTILS